MFGVEAGLDQFSSGITNLFSDADYIPASSTQILSGMVREDLADDSLPVWFNFKTGEWEDKVFGSSVGQTGYDIVNTTANMAPSIVTSIAVGLLNPTAGAVTGAALMGTSAAGNAYQEAVNMGYDKSQARAYSALIGASESMLQYALGGIGKLGGQLSGKTLGKILSSVDNAFFRAAGELGGNMLSEGFEEGLQEVLGTWFKNMVLHADEDVNWNDVAYSTLLGALSSLGLEAGNIGTGKNSGETALSELEQKIVDASYHARLAELEDNGKSLSKREKQSIYESIIKQMERGYISTDTIEELLGGDSYKAWKDTVDREDAINREYEDLGAKERPTLKDQSRFKELETQVQEMGKTSQREQLKQKLGNEVFGLVEGTKLEESYNERNRRSQAFTADLSQYSESARKTVQSAIDCGYLNNTNATHDLIDLVAKVSDEKGVEFDFVNNQKLKESGFALEGRQVNGYRRGNSITLNIDSHKYLNSVVGHEITHVLQGTELYEPLQKAALAFAESKGELGNRRMAIKELYRGLENVDIDAELTADLVGDYLFTDAEFVSRLSTENRGLFQKLFDEIKYLCRIATAGSKEARKLEQVKRTFEKAYRANSQAVGNSQDAKNTATDGGVEYSIEVIEGRFMPVIDTKNDTRDFNAAEEYLKSIVNEANPFATILSDAQPVYVGKDLPGEYKSSEYTKGMRSSLRNVKMQAATNLDEMLLLAENGEWQENLKAKHAIDAKNGWYRYDTEFAVPILNAKRELDHYTVYSGTLLIRNDANGKSYLYDLVDMAEKKKVISSTSSTAGMQPEVFEPKPSTGNISQSANNVNHENSLSGKQPEPGKYGSLRISGEDVKLAPLPQDLQQTAKPKGIVGAPMRTDIQTEQTTTPETTEPARNTIPGGMETQQPQQNGQETETVPDFDFALPRKIRELEAQVADRDGFISDKALELYREIKALKKGVRASEELGYLLDQGYEWRQIKTALQNTMNQPGETVDQRSAMESIVREHLDRLYEDKVYELDGLKAKAEAQAAADVPERYRTLEKKIQGLERELEANRTYMQEAMAGYDSEIAALEARYEAKENKNTKTANDLLRSIERKKRIRNSVEVSYTQRIENLQQRIEKMSSPAYQRAMQRQVKQEALDSEVEELIGDTSTWVDKKWGLSYQTNTLRRNLRDVIRDSNGKRDIAKADRIYDALQGRYNENEAKLNRESNAIKKPYADMRITAAEDAYIQMLGEFRHNPDTKLSMEVVDEFYQSNKDSIDMEKVERAITMARETYDSLLERVNQALREQGMKEIPYRQGYFPHFIEEKQNWLAKLLNWKTQNTDIPTDIAGLTEEFSPNRSWQSFNKQRKSDITGYSFTKGMDTYVQGALDWIYHIEDIQRRRAFENRIRYIHSEQGIKDRIDAIRSNEEYDAEEMQEQIDMVYREAKNPLNNFVTDLRTGTNTLAGKKSSMDRGMEAMVNRQAYSTMTNLSSRVSANMVGGSASSALTNFIPITQSWGQVSPVSSVRAMGETIRSAIRDDGTIAKSDFLTNRLRQSENLHKTAWDKVSKVVGWAMEGIDSFTSQTVWRSKYMENLSQGMSEAEAIKNADQFAENVIAGRSRGNMPTVFDSKNPLIKMATAFQLEVNNQYGYMFKDMPQDMKEEGIGRLVRGYTTMFVGAYIFNNLYSALVGRDAAFDPIGILEELLRDMGVFGEDEKEEPEEAFLNLLENVADELPFISGLTGGGRIPISSALPYDGLWEGVTGTVTDIGEGDWANLTKEWLNPVTYLLPPVGGGQIKKTIEGLSMFTGDKAVSGSYTTGGDLRFPVEKTPANMLQAALFGQWASKNAQDYIDGGHKPLTSKQTQELIDSGMTIQQYWDYQNGLKEYSKQNDKLQYLADLDLTNRQKNILANNLLDRDKPIDMKEFSKYGSLEEYDCATDHPEKYALASAIGGYETYQGYSKALGEIQSDKNTSGETISGSRKTKVLKYIKGLDLSEGEKMLLFKSEYPADDTYNYAIVQYLNGRKDISYKEMVSILKGLDFQVDGKGNISW